VTAKGGLLAIQSDAWAPTGDGYQCISVTEDVTAFNATWIWPSGPGATHSFPHLSFLPKLLPVSLSSITKFGLKASWKYYNTDPSLACNVAVDMFADVDPIAAQKEMVAQYELMVWYGLLGAPWPLGYKEGPVMNVTIGTVDFSLYSGLNFRGHNTMSWLPTTPTSIEDVDMDIAPLFQAMSILLPPNLSLGLIQLGSEAFFSSVNVTFGMSDYSLDLETTSGSETLLLAPTPTSTISSSSAATATSSSTSTTQKSGSIRNRSGWWLTIFIISIGIIRHA